MKRSYILKEEGFNIWGHHCAKVCMLRIWYKDGCCQKYNEERLATACSLWRNCCGQAKPGKTRQRGDIFGWPLFFVLLMGVSLHHTWQMRSGDVRWFKTSLTTIILWYVSLLLHDIIWINYDYWLFMLVPFKSRKLTLESHPPTSITCGLPSHQKMEVPVLATHFKIWIPILCLKIPGCTLTAKMLFMVQE